MKEILFILIIFIQIFENTVTGKGGGEPSQSKDKRPVEIIELSSDSETNSPNTDEEYENTTIPGDGRNKQSKRKGKKPLIDLSSNSSQNSPNTEGEENMEMKRNPSAAMRPDEYFNWLVEFDQHSSNLINFGHNPVGGIKIGREDGQENPPKKTQIQPRTKKHRN